MKPPRSLRSLPSAGALSIFGWPGAGLRAQGELLDAVQRHYPARHYVMVDDKLRTLAAMKAIRRDRLTTIFPRQGHYAPDPAVVAAQPADDFTIEHIDELADLDLSPLIKQPADEVRATQEVP